MSVRTLRKNEAFLTFGGFEVTGLRAGINTKNSKNEALPASHLFSIEIFIDEAQLVILGMR